MDFSIILRGYPFTAGIFQQAGLLASFIVRRGLPAIYSVKMALGASPFIKSQLIHTELITVALPRQTPGNSGGTAQDLHLIPYSPLRAPVGFNIIYDILLL